MINFKFQMESPLISHFIIVEMERASFALFCSSTKNLEITLTGLTGKIVGTIPLQPKLFQHHKKQTFQNISFHTWNHNLPIIICQFYLLYTEGRLTFLYCIRYVIYCLVLTLSISINFLNHAPQSRVTYIWEDEKCSGS